jgi:4-amino-4-deoxy-L-arabinose transferase-like glycosyltransferase
VSDDFTVREIFRRRMEPSEDGSLGAMFPKRERRPMLFTGIGLTVLALLVRLPYFGDGIAASDTMGAYLPVARSIRQGNGFINDFRPPGFPILLAAFEELGIEPVGGVAFLQCLIGVLLPVVLLLIGWRFFNPWVGGLAGGLAAGSPLMAVTELLVLPDYLFGVVFLLATALLAEGALRMHRPRLPWLLLAAAGAAFGLATLLRPNGQLAFALIPIALLIGGREWRRWLSASAISVAALAIVLAPWVIYNYVEYGEATVSTESGVSLYGRVITEERAPPPADSSDGRVALSLFDAGSPTLALLTALTDQGKSTAEASEAMGSLARQAIRREPGEYLLDTQRIFAEYMEAFNPGTLVPDRNTGQIGLVRRYLDDIGAADTSSGDSPATLLPWNLTQILTQLVYVAALGGFAVFLLPFAGARKSRVGGAVMLLFAALGLIAQSMLVRYELRFGVTFAPLVWILFAAAAVLSAQVLVAAIRTGPWNRVRT